MVSSETVLAFALLLSTYVFVFLVGYQLNSPEITTHSVTATLNGDMPETENLQSHFRVDGYSITLVDEDDPSMDGLWGYTYGEHSQQIYLQQSLPPRQLYETCVHEKLHTKGIGESYHPFIEENEDNVVDQTCLRLLYMMDGTLQ